jgi:O-antigen/teichoic acid export membrane protein
VRLVRASHKYHLTYSSCSAMKVRRDTWAGTAELISRGLMWLAVAGLPLLTDVTIIGAISVYVAAEGIMVAFALFGQDRLSMAKAARGDLRATYWPSFATVISAGLLLLAPTTILLAITSGRGLALTLVDLSFAGTIIVAALYRLQAHALRGAGDASTFAFMRLAVSSLRLATLWGLIIVLSGELTAYRAQASYMVAVLIASGVGLLLGRRSQRLPRLSAASSAMFRTGLSEALRLGWPLMLQGMGLVGIVMLDRLMLGGITDFREVGVYTLAYIPASVATFTFAFTAVAWEPAVIRDLASDALSQAKNMSSPPATARLYHRRLMVSGLLAAPIGLLASPVVALLAEADARQVTGLFLILVAAHLAWPVYMTANSALIARDATRELAAAATSALAINLTLNLVLIPILGAVGAAIASLFSYGWLSLRTASRARERCPQVDWLRVSPPLAIGIVLVSVVGFAVVIGA